MKEHPHHRTAAQEEGDYAEQIAAEYFEKRGYTVLERNFRTYAGELDLIVEKGIALVFVEVRFRRYIAFGAPMDTITQGKQRVLVRTALAYVTKKRQMQRLIRFDVISVLRTRDGPRVEHIEDAFEANM